MPKPLPAIDRHLARLRRDLLAAIAPRGLRAAGRRLGDTLATNTHAMRLHRMLRSPAALGLAPYFRILLVCRALDVRIP